METTRRIRSIMAAATAGSLVGMSMLAIPAASAEDSAESASVAASARHVPTVSTAPMRMNVRKDGKRQVLKIRSKLLRKADLPYPTRGLSKWQRKQVKKAKAKKARKLARKFKRKNQQANGQAALASLFGKSGNQGRFHGNFTGTRKGKIKHRHFVSGKARVVLGRKPTLTIANIAKSAPLAGLNHGEHHRSTGMAKAQTRIPVKKGKATYRDAILSGHLGRAAKQTDQPVWSYDVKEIVSVTPTSDDKSEVTVQLAKRGVTVHTPGSNGSAVSFTPSKLAEHFDEATDGNGANAQITGVTQDGAPETIDVFIDDVQAAPAAPVQVKLTVSGNKVQNLQDYTRLFVEQHTVKRGTPALVIVGDSIASGEGGGWRATLQPQGLGKDGSADTKSCFWGSDITCELGNGDYSAGRNMDKAYFRDWGWRKKAQANGEAKLIKGFLPKPDSREVGYECHRSRFAPGLWLADFLSDKRAEEVLGFNYACSGAETKHVKSAASGGLKYQTQPKPQADMVKALDSVYDVEHIVVTIGANDMGFSTVAEECINWLLNPVRSGSGCRDSAAGKAAMAKLNGGLVNDISQVLQDLSKAAPNAAITISDYLSPIAPMDERIEADNPAGGRNTKFNGQPGYNPAQEVIAKCASKYNDPTAYKNCFSDKTYWSAIPGNKVGTFGFFGGCLLPGCIESGQVYDSAIAAIGAPVTATQIRGENPQGNFWRWGFKGGAFAPAKFNIPLSGMDRHWIHETLIPTMTDKIKAAMADAARNHSVKVNMISMKSAANGRSTGSLSNDGSLDQVNGNQAPFWWGARPGSSNSTLRGSVNGAPAGPGGQTTKQGLRAGFFTSWMLATRTGFAATTIGGAASGVNGTWDSEGRKATDLPGSYTEALHPNARGQMAQGLCLAMANMGGAAFTQAGGRNSLMQYCVREPGHSLPAVSQKASYRVRRNHHRSRRCRPGPGLLDA